MCDDDGGASNDKLLGGLCLPSFPEEGEDSRLDRSFRWLCVKKKSFLVMI